MARPARPRKRAPKPQITLGVAGPDANGSATITGKTYARANVLVDVNADGSIDQSVKANNRGIFSFNVQVGYGSSPVQVTGKLRGKKPATTSIVLNRPDTVAPSIGIGSLTPGGMGNSQALIRGAAGDIGTGVNDVMASVDGGPFQAIGFDGAGNFAFGTSFALNGSADGNHVIRFVAHDRAGNASSIVSTNYLLDTTAPSIAVPAATPGSDGQPLTSNQIPTYTVNASDSHGLASLVWTVNGQTAQVTPQGQLGTGVFNFTPSLSSDGVYTISAIATDSVGNVTTRNFALTLDTTNPTVGAVSPITPLTTNQNPKFSVNASDQNGLASLVWTVNGQTAQTTPQNQLGAGNFAFTPGLALDGSADGDYTVQAVATDAAGNVTTQSFVFTLDHLAPSLSLGLDISAPDQNGAVTIQVHGAATPTVGSITSNFDVSFNNTGFFTYQNQIDNTGAFTWFIKLNPSGTESTTYPVSFKVTDTQGHSTIETITFTV
jgi:hypothetical protein